MRLTGVIGLSAQPLQIENLDAILADAEAFRTWYDEVMPRIYRYVAARSGGDDGLAEELTQQTFVRALRRRSTFDGRSEVFTWLCAIARNALVDHYRRRGRDTRRHVRLVETFRTADGAEQWRAHEERDGVERALALLPSEERLALILRYLDDLPVRAVAAALGRSEKATESLLSRARARFRQAHGGMTDV